MIRIEAMKTLGSRIAHYRKLAGLTQGQLAKECGWGSQSRVGNYENDTREPTLGDLERISDALEISLMQLVLSADYYPYSSDELEPAYQPDRYNRYPVINEVQAGEWTEICDQLPLDDSVEWEPTAADAGPHGFWLRVKNDSMTSPSGKSFPEGMLILVHPGLEVMPGQFAVAKLDNSNEATFKKFVHDASGHYLKPLNPSYRMIEINGNCRFVGRVIEAKWADL